MSDFEYSLGRLRAAVERFMEGSPDDFGRHMCNDLLEPMLNEVRTLSTLSETTSQRERDCQSRVDDADTHDLTR
jgi:hypothetical protein